MDLEQLTKDIKDRETARFDYNGQVSIREPSQSPSFSGCMDLLTTAKIELGYNPDYVQTAKPLEKLVANPFEEAFTAIQRHELNHKGGGKFLGCPRNIDLHVQNILTPVAETLKRLEFADVPVSREQNLYAYMANLIEDIFDNTELGNRSNHIGMFLCYKDDAMNSPFIKDKKFTPLFDAFIQLQQVFYGGVKSKAMLEEHYSDDEKVEKAIDNIMERSGLDQFRNEVFTKRKKIPRIVLDRNKATNYCLDEHNWFELSTIITEELANLMDKTKLQQPQYVESTFVPLKGEADSFSDEMGHKETKMRFAWKKYQEGKGTSAEFQPPAYLESFEALDLVYQRLARNLEIKTRASTRTAAMPVMWYGKRRFNPQTDKLSKARIGFGSNGKLDLSVRPYHENHPIEYTERKRSLPEIKFVMLDTSGSMAWPVDGGDTGRVMNPWADEGKQWGNNSRYHHALIAWYGLQELLRKQGTLKHTSVKLANYSSSTKTASNLNEARKLALSPQFGGTNLDLDKIRDMFGRNQLVISLSDGDITNWGNYLVQPETDAAGNVVKEGVLVKDEYISRAKQNDYFHLQIGSFTKDDKGNIVNKTLMCRDLENAGLLVKYDDGKNLGKLVIDLTRPYITRTK